MDVTNDNTARGDDRTRNMEGLLEPHRVGKSHSPSTTGSTERMGTRGWWTVEDLGWATVEQKTTMCKWSDDAPVYLTSNTSVGSGISKTQKPVHDSFSRSTGRYTWRDHKSGEVTE